MGLLKEVISDSLLGNREPFWGKYEELNSAEVPDMNSIRAYQLQCLKRLEEGSRVAQKGKRAATELNELFASNEINSLPDQYAQGQELILNEAITNIVNIIGDFRQLYKYKGETTEKKRQDYALAQIKLNELYQTLSNLQKKLDIQSPIYAKDLERLSEVIKGTQSHVSFGFKKMQEWIKNLNQIQGDLVEVIGTEWFNKRVPSNINIKAFTTGGISLKTKQSNRHSGQLIQDIITVDMDQVDLLSNTIIDYTIGGKPFSKPLGEFLNEIERHSESQQIVIEDNAYDTLLKLSQLNIQAKSGKNQLPWNVNKSTSVRIADFSEEDNRIVSVKRTFQLLQALDEERPTDIWVEDVNPAYNAMTNYGLATVLDKVLHLEGTEGNQYLLTPSGFITYTERMKQIFEKTNGIFRVVGSVKIASNTIEQLYNVSTNWIK